MGPFFAAGQVLGLPPWLTERVWCARAAVPGLRRHAGAGPRAAHRQRAGPLRRRRSPTRSRRGCSPRSARCRRRCCPPCCCRGCCCRWSRPTASARRAGRPGCPRSPCSRMGGINGADGADGHGAAVPVARDPPVDPRAREARARGGAARSLAVCLWWILPLLLLGEYSLPFLDYIESASNTTAPMSLFQVLRGTNQWVAYVVAGHAVVAVRLHADRQPGPDARHRPGRGRRAVRPGPPAAAGTAVPRARRGDRRDAADHRLRRHPRRPARRRRPRPAGRPARAAAQRAQVRAGAAAAARCWPSPTRSPAGCPAWRAAPRRCARPAPGSRSAPCSSRHGRARVAVHAAPRPGLGRGARPLAVRR